MSALGICAFCYMLNLFGVEVLNRFMVNWRRGALVYLLYVKLMWCSGILRDLLLMGRDMSDLGMCPFCYM